MDTSKNDRVSVGGDGESYSLVRAAIEDICRAEPQDASVERVIVRALGIPALCGAVAPDGRPDITATRKPAAASGLPRLSVWKRITNRMGAFTVTQKIALSSVGVVSVVGVLLLWAGGVTRPVSAMEKMAECIRLAKSYKVTMITEIKFVDEPGKPPVTAEMSSETYWLAPKSYRMEMKGNRFAGELDATDIFPTGRPGIHIDHKGKRYHREPVRLGDDSPLMILDKLSQFSGQADRTLGTKEINGKKAWGFEIDGKKIDSDAYPGPVEIWLDSESNLPVFLHYEMHSPAMPTTTMAVRMEDFQWNVALAAKLFEAEAPAGYLELTPQEPGPEELLRQIIYALKTYAELCGGHYPRITRTFAEPVRDDMYKAAGIAYPPTLEQMQQNKEYHRVSEASEGFAWFNRVLRANPDVAYYGKTVGPKDTDKVLLRWKLDDGKYQVIFGDLRNETATAERLRALEGK